MFRGWGSSSNDNHADPKDELTTGLSGFNYGDNSSMTREEQIPEKQSAPMSLHELMANADLNEPDDPFAAALDNMSFSSEGSSIVSSNTPKITVKDPFASDSSDEDSEEESDGDDEEDSLPAVAANSLQGNAFANNSEEGEEASQQNGPDGSASDVSESIYPSTAQSHASLNSEIINTQFKESGDDEASRQDASDEYASDESENSHPPADVPHASLNSEIINPGREYYPDKYEFDQEVPLTDLDPASHINPLKSTALSRDGALSQNGNGDDIINMSEAPGSSLFAIRLSSSSSQPNSGRFQDGDDVEDDLQNMNLNFEEEEDEYVIRSGEDHWQTREGDEASRDYSDADCEGDFKPQPQFLSGQSPKKENDSAEDEDDYRGSDSSEIEDATKCATSQPENSARIETTGNEQPAWKLTSDQEDEYRAASGGLDLVPTEVNWGEGQKLGSCGSNHEATKSVGSDDDKYSVGADEDFDGTRSRTGSTDRRENIPDNQLFPVQQAVVSESEDEQQPRPEKMAIPGELGNNNASLSINDPEVKTVMDLELVLLENIDQARQQKERDLHEKSGVFLSRASNIDDAKSLASTSSRASGFLGLFGRREFGSKSASDRDDDDEGSIESNPDDLLPPSDGGRGLASVSQSEKFSLSHEKNKKDGKELRSTEATAIDKWNSPQRETFLSTMKASAESEGDSFDGESSNEAFVASSKLQAQMKEFGFDDLFSDGVDLQPPDSSGEEDGESSDNGSMSGLIEEIVNPRASMKPFPSSLTDRTDKQTEADRSYHSDVSSMYDDDNVPPDGVSAADVAEKESESSESYETDSSEDDGNFKLGPKEAPLLRLENVTSMTRNIIPEDKIAASNKKNSSTWFGWGRKPVGKSPLPNTQNVIRSAPSPSSSQISSVASSVDSSGQDSKAQPNPPPVSSIETSKPVPALVTEEKMRSQEVQQKAAEVQHAEANALHSARTPPRIEPMPKSAANAKPLHPSHSTVSMNSAGSNSLSSPRKKTPQHPVKLSPRTRNNIKNKSNVLSPGTVSVTGDASIINGGMSTFSGFTGFSGVSADDKRRRRKKKKGLGEHLGKVRKVSRHGDEISVGTLSKQTTAGPSGVQHVVLNTNRDIFGQDDLDSGKRPWEVAKEKKRNEKENKTNKSPKRNSLIEGFFPDTFGTEDIILEEHSDALEDIDNLSKSEHDHYYAAEEAKGTRLLDDFESSSSSDDVSFGSAEREKKDWVGDEAVEDIDDDNNNNTNMEFDELNAMAKLESKLQVETVDVDFDDMWEKVDVDAETALKYEIRKRQKSREKEKNRVLKEKSKDEKSVQRLRLFTKNGGEKRKGKAKLSKEFVRAIQSLFEEDEVAGSSSEDERQKPKRIVRNSDEFSVAPSVKSLYMITGNAEAAGKDHSNNSSCGSAGEKSQSESEGGSDSIPSDVRSLASHRSQRSRSSKSRLDPATVFESEMRRVKQSKVLSVSTLRQEMSDRRGTSINLIQKEYMTFKKKQHQVDRHQPPLNDDSGMDAFQLEGFGMPSGRRGSANSGSFRGSMSDTLHRSLRDEGPIEEKGLAAHFSRWNQEDGVTSLDDLATVQNSPRAQAGTGIGIAAMAKDLAKLPDSVIDLAQRPVYKMSNAFPNTPISLATATTLGRSPKKRTSQSPSPRESPASLPSLSELNGKDSSHFPSTFNDNHLATIAELEDDDDKLGVFGNTKALVDDDGDLSVASDKRKKGGFFGKMGMKRTPKNKKGSMQLLGDEQGLLSG